LSTYIFTVIPAKAGIQFFQHVAPWMPDQVRHDDLVFSPMASKPKQSQTAL
jgi:hypothetical protein